MDAYTPPSSPYKLKLHMKVRHCLSYVEHNSPSSQNSQRSPTASKTVYRSRQNRTSISLNTDTRHATENVSNFHLLYTYTLTYSCCIDPYPGRQSSGCISQAPETEHAHRGRLGRLKSPHISSPFMTHSPTGSKQPKFKLE